MSIIDQLGTQLRDNNVAKLGTTRSFVRTHPALKLFLGVEATPPDLTSQPYRVECAAQVGRLSDDVKAKDEEYLELKSGEKIKVVRNDVVVPA